jgi:hypothetical protein
MVRQRDGVPNLDRRKNGAGAIATSLLHPALRGQGVQGRRRPRRHEHRPERRCIITTRRRDQSEEITNLGLLKACLNSDARQKHSSCGDVSLLYSIPGINQSNGSSM